jgi:hypothetical protein
VPKIPESLPDRPGSQSQLPRGDELQRVPLSSEASRTTRSNRRIGVDLVHSFVLATASEVDSPCPSVMNSLSRGRVSPRSDLLGVAICVLWALVMVVPTRG